MSSVTQSSGAEEGARPHAVAAAAYVVLFWMGAAALVALAHLRFDGSSPMIALSAGIAAVVLTAFAYMRVCAPRATAIHALGVGIAWLVLAIVAEVAVTAQGGHQWFALLGSPAHPLLRNLMLFAWIFSPVLFPRHPVASP